MVAASVELSWQLRYPVRHKQTWAALDGMLSSRLSVACYRRLHVEACHPGCSGFGRVRGAVERLLVQVMGVTMCSALMERTLFAR